MHLTGADKCDMEQAARLQRTTGWGRKRGSQCFWATDTRILQRWKSVLTPHWDRRTPSQKSCVSTSHTNHTAQHTPRLSGATGALQVYLASVSGQQTTPSLLSRSTSHSCVAPREALSATTYRWPLIVMEPWFWR